MRSENHSLGLASDFDSELRIPNSELPVHGRILGVDFGTVRVGLAICDPDRIVASAHETYTRTTDKADATYFVTLATREKAVGFVVGLPISLNGTEGPKAKEARDFGAW